MISRRKFICTLIGAGLGGSALDLWSNDTPFPDACGIRAVRVQAPAGWAGKKALFVTDVHYGNFFGGSEAEALNAIVRRERPDAVLMGGDLAQTPDTALEGFFARWSPGCPTLFAPGNHDVGFNLSGDILSQARQAGMQVLCNASEDWNDITFIGLPSALKAPQRRSLLQVSGLKIVLGHEPDMWDCYDQADLLHLAGHTHGGQVRLLGQPLCLPTLGRRYPYGEYMKDGNSSLVVSSGIGCADFRVRINCPPEIVRLEFV
jgi:predicted MPP superfamily phosphohydrolase